MTQLPGPYPGPNSVVWHSQPGDCLFSFETLFNTGGETYNPFFSITVPPLPDASSGACLLAIVSATNGATIPGAQGPIFTPTGGVARDPTLVWTNASNAWSSGGNLLFLAWSDIGNAGGVFGFNASSFHLNLISGVLIRSANGVAIACVVDPGNAGSLHYPTDSGAPINNTGTSQNPAVTVFDPRRLNALVVGGAAGYGVNPIASTSDGWYDIVSDTQTITQAGGVGVPWGPTTVTLSVYDSNWNPSSLTDTWQIATAPENWYASAISIIFAQNNLSQRPPQIIG